MSTLKQRPTSGSKNSSPLVHSCLAVGLWLILATALLLGFQYFSHSASIDFALHGALVSRLMSGWILTDPEPVIAEMASYPHISHQIASIAGNLSGSAIMGMQQTAILSLFVIWTAIGTSLSGLVRNQYIAALGTLTAITITGSLLLGVELFGNELVVNYHFAQLVSQAAGMLLLIVAMRKEWSSPGSIWPLVLLGISVPILASIHLLAALEMLGTLAILIGLRAMTPGHGKWAARSLPSIGIFAASAALLVANPDFKAMIRFSENNGAIQFRYVPSIRELIGLAAFTAVVSCYMLFEWWRRRHGPISYLHILFKYFGALGLATSGLCIAQILALNLFSMGSPYACFKYVFGMQSLLAIAVALIVAQCLKPSTSRTPSVLLLGGILFAVVMCATILLDPRGFRTDALVAAEISARQYEVARTNRTPGTFDFALGIDDVPGVGNYFLSHGVLGSPMYGISMDVLFSRIPNPPEEVNQILSSPGSTPWDVLSCRRGSAAELVVLDGSCVYATFGEVDCSGTIEFSSRGALDKAISGFSTGSAEGRWSEGSAATLKCKKPAIAPKFAYLNAAGLVSSAHAQGMRVTVNGQPSQLVEYTTQMPAHVARIQLPTDSAPEFVFQFEFPDAISPKKLGLNSDERRLAVMMHSLRFE